MIVVKNITRTFGAHKAVDNVSFTVESGERIVFLGTSGSGKTTLLKMINRLLEPDSGEIRIDGKLITDERPELLRRGIGYVFQNNGLFPHYTIEENIAIVPRLLGWDRARIDQRVTTLMEKLRLPPAQYRGAYPSELSGGQQQRVAFELGNRIFLMDGGRVIQEGTAEDMFDRPATTYVKSFFEGQRYIFDHFKSKQS